jgi:hypothetical protein
MTSGAAVSLTLKHLFQPFPSQKAKTTKSVGAFFSLRQIRTQTQKQHCCFLTHFFSHSLKLSLCLSVFFYLFLLFFLSSLFLFFLFTFYIFCYSFLFNSFQYAPKHLVRYDSISISQLFCFFCRFVYKMTCFRLQKKRFFFKSQLSSL